MAEKKSNNYETLPINKISLDPANARSHPESNLEAIKGSLLKFGQQRPILIDRKNVVIAGNGTLMAAKALGWDKIDIRYTDLTGPEAIAYALADNRTAELAEWDKNILGAQLQALYEDGFGIADIGFDPGEWLKDIVPNTPFDSEKEDEIPTDVPTRVKPGDIWQLGEHRVMCGDNTNAEHVKKLLDGSIPNLMLTDPPYGVKLDNSWRDSTPLQRAGAGNKRKIQNDDRADWTETYALFPGNIAYVWHDACQTHVIIKNLEDAALLTRQMIIWNKAVLVIGRSHYHWKHEPCWYAVRKGKDANWVGDRKQTTVWDAASPNHFMGKKEKEDDKTEHPSQKPVKIYEIPILNHTKTGDGIYDPFLGSGTALMAAEKLGRKCFGFDIDPTYCDIILTRWESLTGRQAVLVAKG